VFRHRVALYHRLGHHVVIGNAAGDLGTALRIKDSDLIADGDHGLIPPSFATRYGHDHRRCQWPGRLAGRCNMRILIVDGEAPARERLKRLLADIEGVKLSGGADRTATARPGAV
jgi:hypothetical protein